jgi:hypothetical protein
MKFILYLFQVYIHSHLLEAIVVYVKNNELSQHNVFLTLL